MTEYRGFRIVTKDDETKIYSPRGTLLVIRYEVEPEKWIDEYLREQEERFPMPTDKRRVQGAT